MRRGEIKALTWPKVDLKAGLIRLSGEDTKSKEGRVIPISPALREMFEEIHREHREGKVAPIGGHVFTWKGRPMGEGWKTAWNAACKRARLEGLWFHDIRHTFVTRKVREGWDYKRIMAITGHRAFEVFQRYKTTPPRRTIKAVVLATPPRTVVQEG